MIIVLDQGHPLSFSCEAMMDYHGPAAPGGVAFGHQLMARAFPLLSPEAPPERRDITVQTSFRGPGLRDAMELVTRAVTQGRYDIDPSHAAAYADLGYRQSYVFHLSYRDRVQSLVVCDGIVRDDFLALGRQENRSKDEESHLAWLKRDMAQRVMALHCSAVFETLGGG